VSAWKGARARFASLRRGSADARMEEEFRFHVEMEVQENIRRGMEPAEARRRALIAFGGGDRHAEGVRDGRLLRWLSDLRQDLRYTWRALGRTPVFAAVAVVTIALGVGATTSLFSLANAVLLRKPPLPGAEHLYTLQEYRDGTVSTGVEGNRIPWRRYVAYREALTREFSGLAAQRGATVSLRTTGDALPAQALLVSGEYFSVLGLPPTLGRFPAADDERVAVLSHRAWRTQYGGAADVIGSTAYINGGVFTIAAVAPPQLDGGTIFGMRPDVWVPFVAYAADRPQGFEQWVTPFGRLAAGTSHGVAQAAAATVGMRLEDPDATVRSVLLESFGTISGEGRAIAWSFLGMLVVASLLVLFIAAANIAGMLLARAIARQREIAVRLAIGAGRGRLIRQLLTETVLLFLLGGVAGVLLAFWLTALLGNMQMPDPGMTFQLRATPDQRVLLFALLISIVPALLFGLLPALQATKPQLVAALREARPGGGVRGVRLRSAFSAGQLAMAVLLLITAGLFVRSLRHGLLLDPGFETDGVIVAATGVTPHGYDEVRGRAFYDQLTARLAARPGVESVALAQRVLLAGDAYGTRMRAADGPADDAGVGVRVNTVDTAYFRTLRMALVAGRGFTAHDDDRAPRVAVINETLARRLWPDEDALGRTLLEGSRELQVVGVMRDGKYVEINESPTPFVFLPYAQNYSGTMVLHVRSNMPAAAVVSAIRDEVRVLDANVALDFTATLRELTQVTLFPQRFAARIIGMLGALGLLLAGIGVYGVLMYHVTQRTHEFGIRMALGARARDVASSVLARSLSVTAIGVTLGLIGAWFVANVLSGFIFGVSVRDPVTFVTVPLLLAVFALLAAAHPAWRACRADPMTALRSD
jgi:predicted permease